MTSILTPFSKLPNRQECTVLIVGDEGTGKHELGLAMLNLKTPYSLYIRTATSLPLPAEKEADRPCIDYICYLVNVTVDDSMKIIEEALSAVDVKYFVGRSSLIVTGVEFPNKQVIEMETVLKMAETYDLPLIFGEVEKPEELLSLATKVTKTVEIASGFKRNVSPMLVEATQRNFEQNL
ncbi:centromere protein M-like [Haliotis cracherodii]|uniref:centromere protein M-like n=1 Tax=Haliotis cracherodii TaxID=6455 RepID=UPI0039EB8BCD